MNALEFRAFLTGAPVRSPPKSISPITRRTNEQTGLSKRDPLTRLVAPSCLLRHLEFPIVLFDPGIGGEQWETMLQNVLDARRRTCVVLLLDECDSSRSSSIASSQCASLYRPLNRERVFSTLFLAYGRCKTYNLRLDAPPRLNAPLRYVGRRLQNVALKMRLVKVKSAGGMIVGSKHV